MNQINGAGTNFTSTLYNANMVALQASGEADGVAVTSGLLPTVSAPNLLTAEVPTGTWFSEYPRTLSTALQVIISASATNYIWIAQDGSCSVTTTYTAPSSLHVCLGAAITNATQITSFDWSKRQVMPTNRRTQGQTQQVSALSSTGGAAVLLPSETDATILSFTGILTSNSTRTLPTRPGAVWFVKNKTTGAFTFSLTVLGGTPITLTQNFGALFMCDGTNIIKVAAEIAV